MGYTNYYTPKKIMENEIPEQFWNDAEKVLDAIIDKGIALTDWNGDEVFESGHDVINATLMSDNEYPSIVFNGYEEESCENFNLCFDGEWECTKTNYHPYDLAVKCILILAEKYDLLQEWSFDGDKSDEEYTNAEDLLKELKLI